MAWCAPVNNILLKFKIFAHSFVYTFFFFLFFLNFEHKLAIIVHTLFKSNFHSRNGKWKSFIISSKSSNIPLIYTQPQMVQCTLLALSLLNLVTIKHCLLYLTSVDLWPHMKGISFLLTCISHSSKFGSQIIVYYIWPMLTFDLCEGHHHHHPKVATADLLTKFGSHGTLFIILTSVDLWPLGRSFASKTCIGDSSDQVW